MVQVIDGASQPAELVLPKSLGSSDFTGLFSVCSAVAATPGPVVLDASQVEFIDPFGLTVLAALLEPRRSQEIDMVWLCRDVAGYMHRMNFFDRCRLASVDVPAYERHDRSRSLTEVCCVRDEHCVDDAARKLAEAILGDIRGVDRDAPRDERTGMNEYEQFRHPLNYALVELLLNALTHARREGRGSARVWVASQYYPARDLVRVGIVDDGCGFLATLQHHPKLRSKTHLGAIEAALEKFVSCNREAGKAGSSNEGVGLTATAKIAQMAGGGLALVSGNGYHNTRGGSKTLEGGARWSGVAIAFSFRRSLLPKVRVEDALPNLDSPLVNVRFEGP